MENQKVVVVKEQKRGGFWPFVGGLLLGAAALKAYDNHVKSKQKNQESNSDNNTQVSEEVEILESMIDEILDKPNQTEKDMARIKVLRQKLKELRNV